MEKEGDILSRIAESKVGGENIERVSTASIMGGARRKSIINGEN
jgi:hypothetical protein